MLRISAFVYRFKLNYECTIFNGSLTNCDKQTRIARRRHGVSVWRVR